MKFRPLHDRVVVRRVEEDTKTKGGIIIPDTAQEKPMQGEVIAVGPGGRDESGKLIPIDVKSGDLVLFGKWSGTEVKLDGTETRRLLHHRSRPLNGYAYQPRATVSRDGSSVSARSCVVTRPIAPRPASARTIASAPIPRS